MPLPSDSQARAIRAIEWLNDLEARQQGRTTALAIGIIRAAARQPGQRIPVRDHAGHNADWVLAQAIASFLNTDSRLLGRFSEGALMRRGGAVLVINRRTPIEDWMPRGWRPLVTPPGIEIAWGSGLDAILPTTPNPRSLWVHLDDEG